LEEALTDDAYEEEERILLFLTRVKGSLEFTSISELL